MTAQSITIGDYSVTLLHDGFFTESLYILTHPKGVSAKADALEHYAESAIRVPVNCFLLQRNGDKILVDCGAGSSWGTDYGHMRTQLADLGIEPSEISHILITHLHGDHALGLIEQDKTYFPQAEIIVPEADWTFYGDEANVPLAPEQGRGAFKLVALFKEICGDRIKPVLTGEVLKDIVLVPLPGHTRGHSGFEVKGNEQHLLLWGDVVHLWALQPMYPEIGVVFDFDKQQAIETRKTALARAADEALIVGGGHLDGFMRVLPRGAAFEMRQVEMT
ncbi:MBL fold metallo-hydrolase [uncultured Cohaesibacter sp.]|uniref:MBL fold metallo-hydrolase n=1 Tax=uncultured Cohaesibacter sp. TaxID=1002546 RepID=UPI0029C7522E|nr:MBL fold metallo-hydrolase [uncultured Cohaesibacter sp.]